MTTVTSKDGTQIALEQAGKGPTLVMVSGATQYRAVDQETQKMFDLLSPHFRVIQYDRRGRGESTDIRPATVQREIEDVEALIEQAGSPAFLFGHSSGAALALRTALQLGPQVQKLALYEPPFNDDPQARQNFRTYRENLDAALNAGKNGEAVTLFMRLVGLPEDQITGMQHSPAWEPLERIAPTLAYDAAALGDEAAIPVELAGQLRIPTLVMNGDRSFPFMHPTAVNLAELIPGTQHRTLAGQTHGVTAEALAPVLIEFLLGGQA